MTLVYLAYDVDLDRFLFERGGQVRWVSRAVIATHALALRSRHRLVQRAARAAMWWAGTTPPWELTDAR